MISNTFTRVGSLIILRRCSQLQRNFCSKPKTLSFEENDLRAKFKALGKGDVQLHHLSGDQDGISVITMSNSSRRNALTGHMMVRLAEVVDELEKWQAGKALILHGDAGTFVSGGDLSVLKEIHTPGEGEQMCFFMHKTFARLQRLPLISLAAIQGLAIGGGAEVALSCDYRLLSRTAEIKFVQARMGLTPGWGGGARLVQLVGRQKAMEILLQCKSMKLEESLMCGLVDGELPSNKDLVTSCTDWLAPYLRCSTSVIRAVKGVVSAGDSFQLDQALHVERSIFSTMWAGEAHDEALSKKIKHK